MNNLVGRESQIQKIQRFYDSPKSEFMAVYGRRRVGKTFLILNAVTQFSDMIFFHVTGIKDATLHEQIENFTRVIGKVFHEGAELRLKSRWMEVFDQLTIEFQKVPLHKKIVLFFDELPWMATKKSKLIQALDHYWNRYWSIDSRIKLIVCGSSASWILDKLINNKSGLYNRITYQINLTPFSLQECKQFLHKKDVRLDEKQIAKLYMIFGGIPLYLDQIQKGLSADQNIDTICFSKEGLLSFEFTRLFESLFENFELNEKLVRIIAKHRYGISQTDISKLSSILPGGRLKKRLQELEDASFIESFIPYLNKEKGIFYRISDEYTLFYLHWIEPVLSSIKKKNKELGYWLSKQKSSSWDSWAGYAFETLCFKHISQIRKKLQIDVSAEIGSWRFVPRKTINLKKEGAQIDLLFDRDDDCITLCEMKYSSTPYVVQKSFIENLLHKAEVFKNRTKINKHIFLTIISAQGIKNNDLSKKYLDGVVVLEDLFRAP